MYVEIKYMCRLKWFRSMIELLSPFHKYRELQNKLITVHSSFDFNTFENRIVMGN